MSLSIENISAINYSSIAKAGAGFRALENLEISEAMSLTKELSPTRAYRLVRGILSTADDRSSYISEARDMINWSKQGDSKDRTMIARAIRNDGGRQGEVFLVHQISGMTREEARSFMIDYFASGGNIEAVVEWLGAAGVILQQHQAKEDGTAGKKVKKAVEWIADKVEDVIDTICESITCIVDAVINAGRDLGKAIAKTVNWAVDAIGGLVKSLIEAGKSVLDILNVAIDNGVTFVRKIVRGMINIGISVWNVLDEAVKLTKEGFRMVIEYLVSAGKAVAEMVVWAVGQTIDVTREIVKTLMDIGYSAIQVIRHVAGMGIEVLRATVEAIIATGHTLGELLVTAITQPMNIFDALILAGREITGNIGNLFDSVRNSVANGVEKVAASLARIGHSLLDITIWAVDSGYQVLKDVVKGIVSGGKAAVDLLAAICSRGVNFISQVIKAFVDIGHTLIGLAKDAVSLGLKTLQKFLRGLCQISNGLFLFAAELTKLTYKAAQNFIGEMIDLGMTVAEIMSSFAAANYWGFRRVVNAIIRKTGRFGEVLDWVLTKTENCFSKLWEDTLQAAHFAGQNIRYAVGWAFRKGQDAVDGILNGWETMGNRLSDFYREVVDISMSGFNGAFRIIGNSTVRLENSVLYVLKYVEKNFIDGMSDFINGVLDVGYELNELVIDLGKLTSKAAIKGLKELLNMGYTLADLLAATMRDPENLLSNLLTAVKEIGMSLQKIYKTVLVETPGLYEEQVTKTLRNLGYPIRKMLEAVVEVHLGALGSVIGILLNMLASYRPMTKAEIATARLIYGNTFDYSRIYFSQESLSNDIISAIQDKSWDPSSKYSRAFVTNTLVNFDVNDGPINEATMIHELCHVWQFQETGPFYMAEALHAQFKEEQLAYNYGYTDENNGNGAESRLKAVFTDNPGITAAQAFDKFNREQQAQIIKHFYVRLYKSSPALDVEPWRPFQKLVCS